MKANSRSLLFWFIIILYVNVVKAQTPPVESVVFENTSFREAISILEQRFAVKISYIDDLVRDRKITANFREKEIDQVLNQLLAGWDIGFRQIKTGHYVLFQKTTRSAAVISGRLQSAGSGLPIPFATLQIRNTNKGVIADANGHFSLQEVPGEKVIIEVTSVGYEPIVLKLDLSRANSFIIKMNESLTQLATVEISPDTYEFSSASRVSFNLNQEELLSPPNIARDLIRNLKLIPGISNDDISAKTRIRGGDWDETGIFFDDLEIYEPFHLEEVDGLASIFDMDLIKETKILTGGFASRYTNKMSGIIEVSTPDYITENITSFSVDLLGGRLNTQQRINDQFNVIGSFRRGYLDLFVRSNQNGIKPRYYDGYFKVNHKLNAGNYLSYHFLFASDDLEFNTDLAISKPEFYVSNRRNLYAWANWKWLINNQFSSQTTLGYQQLKKDSNFLFESSLSEDNIDNRHSGIYSLNNRNYLETSANNDLEFGLEFKAFDSEYEYQENRIDQLQSSLDTVFTNFINIHTQIQGYTIGAYVQDTWRINEKVSLNGGLRFSTESFTNRPNLAPRFAFAYQMNADLLFKCSYGIYYQPENFQKVRVFEGRDFLSSAVMKSIHYVGALHYKKNGIDILLNGYFKDYPQLFDDYRFDFYNRATLVNILDHQDFQTVSGHTTGFEIFLRNQQEWGLLGVNYTYAISKILNAEGIETYRDFDRRHSINFNGVISIGKDFNLSSTWTYHSGNPFTESTLTGISNNTPNELAYFDLRAKNAGRLPNYHSLDIKLEKIWTGRTRKTAYLNIINAYNKQNIRNYHWNGEIDGSGQAVINRVAVGLPEFFISPGFKIQF